MRLKLLLSVFVLVASCSQSISQDTDSTESFTLRTGLMLGASYMHPTLIQSEYLEPAGSFNYQIRGNLYLPLSQKFEVRLGAGLLRSEVVRKDYSITLGSDIDGRNGIDYYGSWTEMDLNLYEFLVPLDLNYNFRENGNGLYFGLGGMLKIAVAASGRYELHESGINIVEFPPISAIDQLRKVTLIPEIRLGYDLKISDKFSGTSEAYLQYSPHGQIKYENMQMTIIGLRLGLRINREIRSS